MKSFGRMLTVVTAVAIISVFTSSAKAQTTGSINFNIV